MSETLVTDQAGIESLAAAMVTAANDIATGSVERPATAEDRARLVVRHLEGVWRSKIVALSPDEWSSPSARLQEAHPDREDGEVR